MRGEMIWKKAMELREMEELRMLSKVGRDKDVASHPDSILLWFVSSACLFHQDEPIKLVVNGCVYTCNVGFSLECGGRMMYYYQEIPNSEPTLFEIKDMYLPHGIGVSIKDTMYEAIFHRENFIVRFHNIRHNDEKKVTQEREADWKKAKEMEAAKDAAKERDRLKAQASQYA